MSKHATLSDKEMYWISPARKLVRVSLPSPVDSVQALWDIGQSHNVTHFWIMPNSFWDNPDILRIIASELYDVWGTYENEEKQLCPRFVRFWEKGVRGHQIKIGWPTRGRFQWGVGHPLDVLATILYLEEELAIEVEWSPGHCGSDLLHKLHSVSSERRGWTRKPSVDLSTIPFGQAGRDLLFVHPLATEDIGKYDICYDKSSSYLAAMIDLYLGSGEPRYVDFRSSDNEPQYLINKRDVHEAGIYRVDVDVSSSRFDGSNLPLIFSKDWCTTKLLNLALDEGYKIWIYEAWIFDEAHKILKPFAEALWSARLNLRDESEKYPYNPARANAYDTVKTMALIGTGKLGESRKDWLFQVVGGARALMIYNLMAVEKKSGKTPFLIYSDEMHYVCDSPDDHVVGMLDRQGKLGGYKVKHAVEITEEMVTLSQECCAAFPRRAGKMQQFIGDLVYGK